MKMSKLRAVFARLAHTAVSLATVGLVLSPHAAQAAGYLIIDHHAEAYGSCETPNMAHNGDAFFHVNTLPLPTYETSGVMAGADGSEEMLWQAGFDSTLLDNGANEFSYGITISTGDNTCVVSDDVVNLQSAALAQEKILFKVSRRGTAYSGSTTLSLGLPEINPGLAKDLTNLDVAIAADTQSDVDNASKTADLAAKLDALKALDSELHDLVSRPLEQVAQIDLDAILDHYTGLVDAGTRAALEQLLNDLKKSVADLNAELARLMGDFAQQANDAIDLATKGVREAGFNPDNPANYTPIANDTVPPVGVPDVSTVAGEFDPSKDPYANYADQVIAQLQTTVSGTQVTGRAQFISVLRGWRANESALQKALQVRTGVSRAETAAFLNAETRVTSFIRQYMSATDWFNDTPVPPPLQAAIDGILKKQFEDAAYNLKCTLNLWDDRVLSPAEQAWSDTFTVFAGGVSAIVGIMEPLDEGAHMMVDFERAAARIGVGMIPVVGDALDLCEVVSGKEWCLPDGRDLSDSERLMSAAGIVIGSGEFWRGAKSVLGAGTVRTIKAVEDAEALAKYVQKAEYANILAAKRLRVFRASRWRALHGAAASLSDLRSITPFETQLVIPNMISRGLTLFGIGEDAISDILKINRMAHELPDFIAITKNGGLHIVEAKGGKELATDIVSAVDGDHCLRKFTDITQELKRVGVDRDIAIFEIAIPKGSQWAGSYANAADPFGVLTQALSLDPSVVKVPRALSVQNGLLFGTVNGVTQMMREPATGLAIHVVELAP